MIPPFRGPWPYMRLLWEEDFAADDDMDYTYYDSTNDGGMAEGWDEEDDEILLDDDDEGEPQQQQAEEEEQPSTKKTTTFSTQPPHVVDHTPSELPTDDLTATTSNIDPSIVVLATEDDLTRDTGPGGSDEEVYDDENEDEYGPVVDHTPQPQQEAPVDATNSMAVLDINDESCFGDSTVEGVGGGWGDDDDEEEEEEGKPAAVDGNNKTTDIALVDHTPLEIGGAAADASVDVVASEDGMSKDGGANDGDSANIVYGPVVDHTPTTPAPVHSSTRSDSVVVQAPNEEEEDEDTMVGASTVGTVEEEIPQVRSEDQLVDHVPARPESRFGDASTLVAADPSEVLSEVDDMMTQEGGNFGPVVDLTPPTQLVAEAPGPSGTGSTVVIAPSVQADDLDDDAVEETEDVDEQNGWEAPAPNPQSGNDEPVDQVNEQVVDFIPPDATETTTREGLSEITVGGAASLLQTEDKEDDFGPVVDQTPNLGSSGGLSQASLATQLTASECRAMDRDDVAAGAASSVDDSSNNNKTPEVVVDQLPQLPDKLTADSLATAQRSQFSDGEEEDDSKFGPVVDHLPTPGTSTGVSRGGSTVDALGTVSEANSDVEDGDGWDDDVDFDVSESCISESPAVATPSARPALRQPNGAPNDQERNMSVRFDSSVNESTPGSKSENDETQYYDPEVGEAGVKVDVTQYFDPDSGTSGDWAGGLDLTLESGGLPNLKSFAEADTPPSTPYRRSELALRQVEEDIRDRMHPTLPSMESVEDHARCSQCENATTTECPCVQKMLMVNDGEGSLVGTMMTPEGKEVQVDFNKLLQQEISRRRLVEEECVALRSRLESQGASAPPQPHNLPIGISNVQQADSELGSRVAELEKLCASLRGDNERLSIDLAESEETLRLRTLDGAGSPGREKKHEIESLRQAKAALSKQIVDLQIQHEKELQQQYELLDKKSSDVRSLEIAKVKLETERTGIKAELSEQRALAKQAESLARELLSVAEERDVLQESLHTSNEAIASLQTLVDEHGMEQEALQSKRSVENAELKKKSREMADTLAASETEASNLRGDCDSLTKERDTIGAKLREVESTAETLERLLEAAKADAAKKTDFTKTLNDELAQVKEKLSQVCIERDEIAKHREASNLDLANLGSAMKRKEEESSEWRRQVSELENRLLQNQTESQALISERDSLVVERDQLHFRCHELENSQGAVLADFKRKAEETSQANDRAIAEVTRECEELREQLLATKGIEEELESERVRAEELLAERGNLSEENDEMLVQFGVLKQQMDASEHHVLELEKELTSMREARGLEDDEMNQELNSLQLEVQTLTEQINALSAENASLSELKQLEPRCRDLSERCMQQEEELVQMRQSVQTVRSSDNAALEELRKRVQALESMCADKEDALASRDKELEALRRRIATMADKSDLEPLQIELSRKNDALTHQLARAKALEEERESLLSQLDGANGRLVAVDGVPDLQRRIETLNSALQATRARLASKEAEVDRLSSDMVRMESISRAVAETNGETSEHSEGVASDIESLRAKVVSLAADLERSETRRAEALETLQLERNTHTESVRRLGESMKRFYTTVSLGDA